MASDPSMRCPRCHASYDADFEFCPRDGCRLESTTAPFADPLIGSVIDGRYRVVGVLGRGGSGTVYRAEQLTVDRPVALKVIAADAAGEAQKVKRFEQEARTLSRLRHPNTLKLIDFGRLEDGRPYIVNMLLRGRSLAEVLAAEGTLGVERTLRLMRAVCDALTEAHAEGVVHRDLKPENIFIETVADQEVVKVIDFGVARLLDRDTKLTEDGTSMGTVAYMSPEQIRGEPVRETSDLYSLGIVGYECLTGRAPFVGSNYVSIAMQHLSEVPDPLVDRAPLEVPDAVDDLIMACLEKLPADRPADAATLRDQIDACVSTPAVGELSDQPPGAPPPVAAAPPPTTRGGAPLWLIGVLALALIACVVVLLRRPETSVANRDASTPGTQAAPAPRVAPPSRAKAPTTAAPVTAAPITAAPASAAPPDAAPVDAAPQTRAPASRTPAVRIRAPRTTLKRVPPPGLY